MASVNEKELGRIIRSGELKGAYYIYGNDNYSVAGYKREMVKKLVAPGDETYNLHEFRGKELDVQALSQVCEGLPVFAEKLCVTVCDPDMEGDRAADARIRSLTETAANLPESTVLIFYTGNIDVCGGKKYPTPKNKKLIDFIAKHGTVCEINVRPEGESAKTICAMAASAGGSIEEKAARLLWRRCCGNMTRIENEIGKLLSYTAGKPVTAAEVELLTPEENDTRAYNLADAAAAGNVSRAAALLSELLENRNDPIYLLYVLMGSMNDLYRARLALDYNHSVGDVVKDFGYARAVEFRVKNAFASARRFSAERLRQCMEILAQADLEMKSGAGAPEVILERAVIRTLCAGGKGEYAGY